MSKKVMVIIGTRPEATKMGPVIRELRNYPEWFDTLVVATGQHRQQLDQALAHFGIRPDLDLNLMKENQTLAYLTSAAITALDRVISEERPDFILVHGDTQTAVCGAMAAFFHKIPTGHVEAGLRSYNKTSPWPEEINRKIIDVVSDYLFAPTPVCRDNLLREGYPEDRIHVTGQSAVDAAMMTIRPVYRFKNARLSRLLERNGRTIAVTAHRRENYGEPMRRMFRAIRRVADDHPDVAVIYPVHRSPAVREAAREILGGMIASICWTRSITRI